MSPACAIGDDTVAVTTTTTTTTTTTYGGRESSSAPGKNSMASKGGADQPDGHELGRHGTPDLIAEHRIRAEGGVEVIGGAGGEDVAGCSSEDSGRGARREEGGVAGTTTSVSGNVVDVVVAPARVATPDETRMREVVRHRFSSEAWEAPDAMRRELAQLGQRELQAMFWDMFDRPTTSNNNQWLRRRIASGLGIDEPESTSHVVTGRGVVSGKRSSARRAEVDAAGTTTAPRFGASPAGESTDAVEYTPDGLRKSRRAVKPKTIFDLDSIPSASKVNEDRKKERKRLEAAEQAAASTSGRTEAPAGKASVGRRVRVYWTYEQQFFAGVISAYNPRTDLYSIDYDDGDKEEIALTTNQQARVAASEEPATQGDAGASTADWPALTAKVDESLGMALPQPGKSADILKTLPASWPPVGALVWGRVRGHGWWPGSVHSKDAGTDVQEVNFFDNSNARVHRHDLLPFHHYFMVLRDAKKTQAYASAIARATEKYEDRRSKSAKRKSKKEGGGVKANNSESPRIWHFEAPKKHGHKRSVTKEEEGGVLSAKKTKHGAATDLQLPVYGAPKAAKTMNDLTKSLEDMKSKVLPLAKESRIVFNDHLSRVKSEELEDDGDPLISADERTVVLDELSSIESLIDWVKTDKETDAPQPAGTPDFAFMSNRSWERTTDSLTPAEAALLRQPSQDLLGGNLATIGSMMLNDPMGLSPICASIDDAEAAGRTAPSTPEQQGDDGVFTKAKMSDSCEALHGDDAFDKKAEKSSERRKTTVTAA
jgi:hypothetical protein